MDVKQPNFFLVGAAKSGTTTLYHALIQHDDVYLPAVKEPHFYGYLADPELVGDLWPDAGTAREAYHALYADLAEQSAIGDASTTNLVVPGAAAAIAREVPEARIVVVLRHPVERAFSHFGHFVAAGGEDLPTFADAVRAEPSRRAEGLPFTYQYLGWSRYVSQLRPYFELFGRDRVLVHLYDELRDDGEAVVRETFRFLSVDDTGALPPVGRSNETPAPPAAEVRRGLLGRLRSSPKQPQPPTLDPGLRAELTEDFAEEISQLEELLDRDLSVWR